MNRLAACALLIVSCHPVDRSLHEQLDRALTELEAVQTDDRQLAAKLESMSERIDGIDQQGRGLASQIEDVRAHEAPPPPPLLAPPVPDAKTVYAVPIAGSPVSGKDSAKITLVEFTDFACPFCLRTRATLDELHVKYGDELRVVHKDFIVHPIAHDAALAACAAGHQGKWFDMAHLIWMHGWDGLTVKDISSAEMSLLAAQLGLDLDRYKRDVAGADCARRLTDDAALAAKLGVTGTPTFYINGRPLIGAQPIDKFESVIDEELAKANASSLRGADYYENLVKTGKPSIK